MKKISLLFALLLAGPSLFSQMMFQRTYGVPADNERSLCVTQTPDGGYIFGGRKEMGPLLTHDMFLVKTDAEGDTMWTRTYGGPGEEICWSVEPINAGYFVFGGTTSYGSGNWDIQCMILDLNGDTIRTRVYGGPQDDYGQEGAKVGQTLEGDFIFSGMTSSYGAGGFDVYLLKVDMMGNLLWSRTYGGVFSESALVVQTPDSGFVFAGYTTSFGAGVADYLLFKTDRDGNFLWGKAYGGTAADICQAVSISADGGFLLTGLSNSFSASDDILSMKTDASGNVLWAKLCSAPQDDWGRNGSATADGGFVVTGKSMSFGNGTEDFILLKFDSTGNVSWAKDYPGIHNEIPYGLTTTSDGGYILCGGSSSFSTTTAQDIMVIKTNANGVVNCNEFNITFSLSNPSVTTTPVTLLVDSGGVALPCAPVKGSGTNLLTVCTNVGMEEPAGERTLRIYPVPAQASVTVEIAAEDLYSGAGQLTVHDVTGRIVATQAIVATRSSLDCTALPSGIYLCRVTTAKGDSRTARLIVE